MSKLSDLRTPTPRQFKAIRAWKGISQAQAAKAAGLNQATLVDFERGNRTPTPETKAAIGLYVGKLKDISWAENVILLTP